MKKLPILKKRTLLRLQRGVAVLGTIALVLLSFPASEAQAAAVTAMKDTLSRAKVSTTGTNAFAFTTATALTATQTIGVRFDIATDAFTLAGTIAAADFSAVSGMTIVDTCTGAASEVQPTVDATAPDERYIFTVCTSDTVAAGAIAFTIASGKVTNPSSQASYKVDIITTSDSGSLAVGIVTNDQVNITATVDPSITFTISDVTIGFGTLTSSAVRYATGDTLGGTTETTAAHTLSLGTNATSGMVLTYNGALLTSGANTIDAASNITPPGTTGIEQFGIAFDDNGSNFTIGATYDQATPKYTFVASTTTQVMSTAGPVASTTVDAHYFANISASTQSGSYATDLTYIATGTF